MTSLIEQIPMLIQVADSLKTISVTKDRAPSDVDSKGKYVVYRQLDIEKHPDMDGVGKEREYKFLVTGYNFTAKEAELVTWQLEDLSGGARTGFSGIKGVWATLETSEEYTPPVNGEEDGNKSFEITLGVWFERD